MFLLGCPDRLCLHFKNFWAGPLLLHGSKTLFSFLHKFQNKVNWMNMSCCYHVFNVSSRKTMSWPLLHYVLQKLCDPADRQTERHRGESISFHPCRNGRGTMMIMQRFSRSVSHCYIMSSASKVHNVISYYIMRKAVITFALKILLHYEPIITLWVATYLLVITIQFDGIRVLGHVDVCSLQIAKCQITAAVYGCTSSWHPTLHYNVELLVS